MESETVDFYTLLAKLRDFHNAAAEALDAYIQTKTKAVLKEYDVEKIKWTTRQGTKGEFQHSEDADNADFKALSKDLADHKNFMYLKGWNYWIFLDGVGIGRKKAAR